MLMILPSCWESLVGLVAILCKHTLTPFGCNESAPKLANVSCPEDYTQHFHCTRHVSNVAPELLVWVLNCKQFTTDSDNLNQDL